MELFELGTATNMTNMTIASRAAFMRLAEANSVKMAMGSFKGSQVPSPWRVGRWVAHRRGWLGGSLSIFKPTFHISSLFNLQLMILKDASSFGAFQNASP